MSDAKTTITNPVILWDLSSKLDDPQQWSPKTMKARSVLNYKGIPFEVRFTTYTEFPLILQKLNIPPWQEIPHYTLPAISHDGNAIMGSDEITDYLEKAFPQNPSVYPTPQALTESDGLRKMIPSVYQRVTACSMTFISQIIPDIDHEYFINKLKSRLNIDIIQLINSPAITAEGWAEGQGFVNGFKGFTTENFTQELLDRLKSGKYLFGDYISYADLHYFSVLSWVIKAYSQDKTRTSEFFSDKWLQEWYNKMSIYGV
ncbi:hypothetical protein BABINDRAFT_125394 [Babjeviella inositovora NRRL Y-12698]|uniref:GST N-terminal domain-containing protein n=1 Tax=Babjeviella inositovora NRRL Y-12698 TaxID=984486 RepID=A0A1E3QUE8_9ASCO|nr:uncharacterized protein BABINDRAFT_125394 [Babjeviella inositovora NRRL Y-12698]ODQ80622.1 hypothetical protein BABINDRAFT_125394 [Babjeviella inositovora NRRL Y-12698]